MDLDQMLDLVCENDDAATKARMNELSRLTLFRGTLNAQGDLGRDLQSCQRQKEVIPDNR